MRLLAALETSSLPILAIAMLANTVVADLDDSISELGYGTKFGTEPGQAVPGRSLGLGASPGPVSGEEGVLLDVLHRLELYKKLAGKESNSTYTTDPNCGSKCPPGAHCSYGLCFCDAVTRLSEAKEEVLEMEASANTSLPAHNSSAGEEETELVLLGPLQSAVYIGSLGKCTKTLENTNETSPSVGQDCTETSDCWEADVNSICSEDSTCQCKPGMVYSDRLEECALDVSVDCSSISPDSPTSTSLTTFVDEVMAGNHSISPSWPGTYDSLLAYIDPNSEDKTFLLEAFCRDVDVFAAILADKSSELTVGDAIEDVVDACATILGLVVAILLLCLVLLCLAGCICYCCHDACRLKIKSMFAPTNYAEGLDNKAATGLEKDAEAGEKDDLEKVISGYQPVPQQPPPSYPQGANSLPRASRQDKMGSLPRGSSLPRNTSSLKRGVSPIPRAYPALAEAPPGYPESPQKTGVPPLGFPQSPPEYPQTPTPPGFPANQNKQAAALYPTIPEK